MKKLSIILIVLILPLLLTGCTKKDSSDDTVGKMMDDKKEEAVSGSIFDIMKRGKPTKCVANFEEDGNSMSITTYVSGKKAYSETEIKSTENPEENMKIYSIIDDEWMYSWGSMGMATKMSIKDLEDMSAEIDVASEDTEDPELDGKALSESLQNDLDYKCSIWIPNPEKFNPPKDIDFMDLNETLDAMMGNFEEGDFESMMDMSCDMCDYMPTADEIAKCKADVGCN